MVFGGPFAGFDDATLSVFDSRKQSSNQYNRERMAIREALRDLGEAAAGPLTRERSFSWEVSPHVPCLFNQHRVEEMVLFFTRTEEQRKAVGPLIDSRFSLPEQVAGLAVHQQHLHLGIRVGREGVEMGLMAHSRAWLDVMNLLNRCRQPSEALELVHRIRTLPAEFRVRIGPETWVDVPEFEESHLEHLEHAVLHESFRILIGRLHAPGSPDVMPPNLRPRAVETLTRLLPIWDFWAWRPTSNWLLPESQVPSGASSSGPSGRDTPRVSSGGGSVDFGVGDSVRIEAGILAGRDAVVTEIDGRGQARVLVGKVALRVDARHLSPLGRR
ncbi:MAG TPA: hypothetical protein PLQ97_02500 [Myxococcota bacterium]|nr:hypothetical protein [Myxococcota bacterium]HQK50700.1 hypothetical protein [Myxococcota bacterium]